MDKEITLFSELIGKTLIEILNLQVGSSCVIFRCSDGTSYALQYEAECCGDMSINRVLGNRMDLLDSPVTSADEWSIYGHSGYVHNYCMVTSKGSVVVRWFGAATECDFEQIEFGRLAPDRKAT